MLLKRGREKVRKLTNVGSRCEGGLREKELCYNPSDNPLHESQHLPRVYHVPGAVLNIFPYSPSLTDGGGG